MPFSKSLFQGGELTIDHRASPGLTEEQARRMGYDFGHDLLREGKLFICDTIGCIHCGGVWKVNYARKRERHYCSYCGNYQCDACHAASREPDYVHYTINELAEKCRGGKFMVVGPDQSHLKLVPIGDGNG